jgi:tetratricopeptide (TPR) repeat protein
MEEILDLKTYYENYDKGCQAAQEKDYAKASQAFTDAFQIAQRYDLPTDASQKAEEAQSFLRKADLKSYYEYYEQGTQAVLQKDYEKAARAFSQAFQIAQKIGLPSDACEKAKLLQSPERAAEFNAYQENYSKGVQAAEQKDYAKAAQAFQEAVRIAQSLGLFTDASDKAQKMLPLAEKLSAALSDLDCVMRMCAERNDPYAIYAAATYYLSSDEYAVRYQDLKAKLEAARTTVASHREMFPSLRSTKTLQITVLTMRNGQVVKGKVLERNGKFIRFHQETDGKSSTRMIMAGDVADIKEEVIKPEEANNKLAAELLTQALSQMDSRHPVKALSKIGQIECELSDVPLMKNVEEQKRILASVSAASGAKGRANLQSFVAACVERCQSMCSKCDGLGRMPCPTCRGLGKMELNCGSCGGTGTAPCPDCAGRGKTNDGRTRCPHCAGKGVLKCIRCAGKGKISQPCLNCAGGTVPCDACLGTGQRPATPR